MTTPLLFELAAKRLGTLAFIAANPSVVVLTPRVRVKDGSGTRLIEALPRAPQTARLIDEGSLAAGRGGGSQNAQNGTQRLGQFQLLLPFDGQVGLYDTWIGPDGIRFEVVSVLPDNGYERRAEVIRYGEKGQP